MKVEFVDELPAPKDRHRADPAAYQEFVSAVREQPGKWAKLPSELGGDVNRAASIRNGTGPAAFRGGGWDAVFRNGQLYIRYVGDGTPPAVVDRNLYGRSPVGMELAAALRRRPLEWKPWPTPLSPASARTYRNLVPAGKLKSFPVGEFQAKVRGNSELLVRFVGGAQ